MIWNLKLYFLCPQAKLQALTEEQAVVNNTLEVAGGLIVDTEENVAEMDAFVQVRTFASLDKKWF